MYGLVRTLIYCIPKSLATDIFKPLGAQRGGPNKSATPMTRTIVWGVNILKAVVETGGTESDFFHMVEITKRAYCIEVNPLWLVTWSSF